MDLEGFMIFLPADVQDIILPDHLLKSFHAAFVPFIASVKIQTQIQMYLYWLPFLHVVFVRMWKHE